MQKVSITHLRFHRQHVLESRFMFAFHNLAYYLYLTCSISNSDTLFSTDQHITDIKIDGRRTGTLVQQANPQAVRASIPWIPVDVVVAPIPVHLLVYALGKQQNIGQDLGQLHPYGRQRMSGLLASDQFRSGNLEGELVGEKFFPSLQIFQIKINNFFKKAKCMPDK